MSDFKTAQDVLPLHFAGSTYAGFNRRVYGEANWADAFRYQAERFDRDMNAGWEAADKMIREGKIFYVHNFHSIECHSKHHAFQYGGFWVCNGCGNKGVDKPWWTIKVMQDGNAWCCVGDGFINLQESDNYAFGDTREEAIENYGRAMISPASTTTNAGEKNG